jgi:hypothetical protein
MNEIWKTIEGFDGYEVSNIGNIRSFLSRGHRYGLKRKSIPHQKKLNKNHKGYYLVGLGNKKFMVSRLVGEAFIKNIDNKPQINHKNGIKTDNRVENLEWVTASENTKHGWKNGLIKMSEKRMRIFKNGDYRRGTLNGRSKLNENQVMAIKSLRNMKTNTLARIFGVTTTTIRNIQNGKLWKHLTQSI